jgi:hypothetical protein
MGKMLLYVRRALANKTEGDFNLPRLVLGDSLHSRYQPVRIANREAGKAVSEAVAKLKDVPFDGQAFRSGPMREFTDSLEGLGIKHSGGKMNFRGSDLEGAPEAQAILLKIRDRIADTDVTTLRDVHRLKKFIDNMVGEYGKNGKGLAGDAEYVVKQLRHNVNNFIREFGPEEYAKANDIYSETIEALETTQRLIGKNNNPTPSNLAKAARKALSNYQTGDQIMDNLIELERLATKYGSEFPDDLKTQISVVQSIERLFPSAKPANSLGGTIDSSINFAKRMQNQGFSSAVMDTVADVGAKVLGKGDDLKQADMLEVLESLIAESRKKSGK